MRSGRSGSKGNGCGGQVSCGPHSSFLNDFGFYAE